MAIPLNATLGSRFLPILLLLSTVAAAGCTRSREVTFRNLIVVVVDTLRSDHLPSYGYGRDTAPFLSGLAAEGIQLQGYSASSWTRPSMATLLTGFEPQRHQTLSRSDSLAADIPYLPAWLAARGFRTAAYIGNLNAGRPWGFARGFEQYGQTSGVRHDEAERVTNKVLGFELEPPFYLQILYVDPHDPYLPPEPWRDDGMAEWPYVQPRRLMKSRAPIDELAIDRMKRQYDGEILDFDRHFQRLVETLDAAGHLDETLVVVTADHGEEFGEHDGLTHGKTLYEEVLRVPFILWSRVGLPRYRSDAVFHHVDFMPTMLSALGLEAPEDLDGESRWAAVLDSRPERGERDYFFHLDLGRRAALAVRRGDRKLIHRLSRPHHLVSDLAHDPSEGRPASSLEAPDEELFGRLIRHHNHLVERRWTRRTSETDLKLRQSLAALGYLDVDTPEEELRQRLIPDRLPEAGLAAVGHPAGR